MLEVLAKLQLETEQFTKSVFLDDQTSTCQYDELRDVRDRVYAKLPLQPTGYTDKQTYTDCENYFTTLNPTFAALDQQIAEAKGKLARAKKL